MKNVVHVYSKVATKTLEDAQLKKNIRKVLEFNQAHIKYWWRR